MALAGRRLILAALAGGSLVLTLATGCAAASPPPRPGCGSYCQQAGGFGGGPEEGRGPVYIPAQTVRAWSNGVITLRATCRKAVACVGAILLNSLDTSLTLGRSDLRIPARRTVGVRVGLNSSAMSLLRRRGRLGRTFATAALPGAIAVSRPLVLLAPRP